MDFDIWVLLIMALSTQEFLGFSQIREGAIVLKDKSLRGVLMVSSLNFELKAEEEKNATIFQFQTFLNSLDFPCQIIAQSRKINITGYFEKIKEFEEKQENELLKIQTAEYRKFIESLVEEGTIMKKNFFVVVPYTISEIKDTGKGIIGEALKKTKIPVLTEENFQRCRDQLWQRMEFTAVGLWRCGLTAIPLTTPELIELLWSWYHPKEAEVGYYPEIIPELMK